MVGSLIILLVLCILSIMIMGWKGLFCIAGTLCLVISIITSSAGILFLAVILLLTWLCLFTSGKNNRNLIAARSKGQKQYEEEYGVIDYFDK